MTEEIKHKKRKFLFNPLKRPLPYVGLIIAIVLIIFQQTIRNYVSDTIGDVLVNSMREATDGVYKTTYDLVRFDIISKELRISNLKIELDTTVISREDYLLKRPNLIQVSTPLIVVKLRSILPLLFSKQLYISYVGAKEPSFDLIKSLHSTVEKGATKNSQEDFREVIKTYFSAFEIDSFRVEKGAFNISTHTEDEKELSVIHIGEFTTMLKNFRLDSLSPSILLKGIRARSFELEIIDQNVNLPNINQNIYFSKLKLSTIDSTFVLDSLEIGNIEHGIGKSNANYSIKKLEVLGFNFERAFLDNSVSVNEIHIIEPNVYFEQLDFSKPKPKKKNSSGGIFDYFKQLEINQIKLYDGSLEFKGERLSKVDNFSFDIADYNISPNDWKNKKAISDFKLVHINASGISQELPDSIHTANVESVIYDGIKNRLRLNKLLIKPISGRNSYKNLKARNTNFSTYSSINSIELIKFMPEDLVLRNNLEVDSVIINKPTISVIQYPGMYLKKKKRRSKKNGIKFTINHFITNNGSLKLRAYENRTNHLSNFNGLYINSSTITEATSTKNLPTYFRLLVSNGSTQVSNIGHTATFKGLKIDQTKSIFIEGATLKPDSSTLPYNRINASLSNVLVEGVDLTELQSQSLKIDSILIGKLNLESDFTRLPFEVKKKAKKKPLKRISIGKFNIKSANLDSKQKGSLVLLTGANIGIENIQIDSLQTKSKPVITFNNTLLNAEKLSFSESKNGVKVTGKNIGYNEFDSTFTINNINYTSKKKDATVELRALKVFGFDKEKLTNKNELDIRKVEIIKPSITLIANSKSDSLKKTFDLHKIILSKGIYTINLDSLLIIDGNTSVALPSSKKFNLGSFKGIITNYKLDTTSTFFSAISNFKGVFEFKDIYLRGLTDTLNIAKAHLDTYQSFIWTDSIHFEAKLEKNNIKILSPGIAIDHINIPKLLESKINISRVSTRNNFVTLTQTDTTKSKKPFKIPEIYPPLDIIIGDINFVNTSFRYNKIGQKKHLLTHLNFDIKLDSLEALKGSRFHLATNTADSRFRVYDFSFDLPDSLNTIEFDTLLVSSRKSQINISNFALKARYPKYEYGNQAGRQVDWKDLLLEKIRIENIDFVELIENKAFQCQKITLNNGHLKLFKDKQLPFPTGRVVPILQERVMQLKTPLKVDSIEIKNFDIYQSTLQSTGLQEGGITFIDTDGLITNITNDSSRLLNNKFLNVVASTKIMGSGNLYTEMDFDMLDKNNLFFFTARLGAMDAKAFNNILQAAAFVKVSSGEIKSLNLQATGNKKYAYGDMSFIYNNLKIETINKKTLETKGMGKVIKTFFANAFVVKKKNSRVKFLRRRGGMYYERDISRVTIDYMAKTAISGLVSSIGAKSNNKQIKQIAKDNKAARDLELKQEKELKKAAKKEAKKSK